MEKLTQLKSSMGRLVILHYSKSKASYEYDIPRNAKHKYTPFADLPVEYQNIPP